MSIETGKTGGWADRIITIVITTAVLTVAAVPVFVSKLDGVKEELVGLRSDVKLLTKAFTDGREMDAEKLGNLEGRLAGVEVNFRNLMVSKW